jgi:DNA-binding CsgD family transcriptional regulator
LLAKRCRAVWRDTPRATAIWFQDLPCARATSTASRSRASSDRTAAGLPPQRRTCRDILTLTAREQDVAKLTARGLTTREIAKHLYVSGKAVQYHLSNIYAKLGLNSRRQLRDLIQ